MSRSKSMYVRPRADYKFKSLFLGSKNFFKLFEKNYLSVIESKKLVSNSCRRKSTNFNYFLKKFKVKKINLQISRKKDKQSLCNGCWIMHDYISCTLRARPESHLLSVEGLLLGISDLWAHIDSSQNKEHRVPSMQLRCLWCPR